MLYEGRVLFASGESVMVGGVAKMFTTITLVVVTTLQLNLTIASLENS